MRAALALMLLPAMAAADLSEEVLTTPSGLSVRWLDTVHTAPGHMGLTYRFRFLAPDLAAHQPGWAGGDEGTADDALPTPAFNAAEAVTEPLDDSPAPDIQLRVLGDDQSAVSEHPAPWQMDPVVQDLHWLCESYALPRIASPAPRPRQIVISLSERPVPFGAFTPGVLQVFESFALPPDRDICLWEVY